MSVHTHANIHAHTTQTIHTYMYIYASTVLHKPTIIHTDTHTYCKYTVQHMVHTVTCTCTHTPTHTYVRTYIHTHVHQLPEHLAHYTPQALLFTFPVSDISPVMANSCRTGSPWASDRRADTMVQPALGPSLGVAPWSRGRVRVTPAQLHNTG